MSSVALPALPEDVLGLIAWAALAAEGNDAQAWARLSLVCCAWRETLFGARFARPFPPSLVKNFITAMLCVNPSKAELCGWLHKHECDLRVIPCDFRSHARIRCSSLRRSLRT